MESLVKTSECSEIKKYFEAIFRLSETGREFPVDLDSVWGLVYNRKDHAVRDLKSKFIEGVDYQCFPKNGETENGGFRSFEYMLSVSCLEYFIARKVRDVFEVYRKVFHGVKKLSTPNFSSPAEAARAWADQYEVTQRALAEKAESDRIIEEQKPDVEFSKSFTEADESMLINDVAKMLEQNDIIIGAKKSRPFLCDIKFIYKSGDGYELYKTVLDRGYAFYRDKLKPEEAEWYEVKPGTIRVTPKGYKALVGAIKGKYESMFLKYGRFK